MTTADEIIRFFGMKSFLGPVVGVGAPYQALQLSKDNKRWGQ
jgi:hypothetical protein